LQAKKSSTRVIFTGEENPAKAENTLDLPLMLRNAGCPWLARKSYGGEPNRT